MRKLVVTEFVTLDNIMESPHVWSFDYWNREIGQFKLDEVMASDALLLGRVTYEEFAAAWPVRKDEQGFADRMNSNAKYVVSTTLTPDKATWNNTTVIREDVVGEVEKLKHMKGQDILVAGSATLIETLMLNGLVDEYRLLMYPVVLGKGKHLFKEGSAAKLKLVEVKKFKSGVVLLRYVPEKKTSSADRAAHE